ncbi:hypothetical protein GCK32_010935, partial [Trichostrongylus colubriformis]
MEVDEDEKKAEKRAKSEAQRIASIRAKKELEKQRSAILSKALREVDQKRKHVVFADSDDEDNLPSSSQASTQKSSAAHVKLFEDSSSEGENEDTIKISNRHEGKKGEKLMKLEARFNSDSRFKLDEKFVSSGSEEEEEDEVVQERTKHLEVLSKVLGSTIKPQKKTLKSSEKDVRGHAKVRPFTRFDPFNEEHVRWLEKEEGMKNGANSADCGEECNRSDDSEGSPKKHDIHYEMQPDFAEELKARMAAETPTTDSANGSSNFSFLAMMGRKAAAGEKSVTNDQSIDIIPNKRLKMILDSVGDDEGVDAKVVVPARSDLIKSSRPTATFFVTGEEEHLQSLISNFKRTQPLERIVPQWANHRDVFAKKEQITAEYRARVKCLHPDKLDEADSKKYEEYLRLQAAYDTLSDDLERDCYNAWLDCLLPLSYEEFRRNRDAVKVTYCILAYSLDGLVVVALLIICSCAYLKRVPRINSWLLSEKKGFFGILYKVTTNSKFGLSYRRTFALFRLCCVFPSCWIYIVPQIIMVQHKVKQKTTLPKGVKQKTKKTKPAGPKRGHNLYIPPKKQHLIQQDKVGAEVTKIINEKNEEMVKGQADSAVGRNQK